MHLAKEFFIFSLLNTKIDATPSKGDMPVPKNDSEHLNKLLRIFLRSFVDKLYLCQGRYGRSEGSDLHFI